MPLAPIEALYGAWILACQNEGGEALRLVRRIGRRYGELTPDEALSGFACFIMEDILAVNNEKRPLGQLRFLKRNRLLRIVYFFMVRPVLPVFRVMADILAGFHIPDGLTLRNLTDQIACQCWVYGLPGLPSFLGESLNSCPSPEVEEEACRAYQECVITYLRHWLLATQNLAAVLLASVKPGDAHALYGLVRQYSPKVILEIGTFTGFSTSIMARAVRDNDNDAIIHCIDPNLTHIGVERPLDHARQFLHQQHLDEFVIMHEGFFSEPREVLPSGPSILGIHAVNFLPPVDFAFIDGSHTTLDVITDVRLLLPVLADTATLVFHDVTTWHSVRQAIHLMMGDDAWQHCFEYHDITPRGFDGLGVINFKR